MSFLTSVALLVGLLAGVPIAAHLLRRRRATEVVLPTAKLLAGSPSIVRRRSVLEDRALLALRMLAVLALALLGATPFVSCSHVALFRKDGASVAVVLVLDDSLSMRQKTASGETRFELARRTARDLVKAAQPGDTFAIVLAGNEPRVHLASSSDPDAVRAAIDALEPSDRSTDLEGAIAIARDLVRDAPQPDRRVTLLSDLADGRADGSPLEMDSPGVTLWYPLPELASPSGQANCAITGASRGGSSVDVSITCRGKLEGRRVQISKAGSTDSLASASFAPDATDISLEVPADAPDELIATLLPPDVLPEDDVAPVMTRGGRLAIAVLADAPASRVQTGGPPPIEQALSALELGPSTKPLAAIPEHVDELAPFGAMILDDPPGLTPEERRAVIDWVDRGGSLLLSLGRHATAAPLGAGFAGVVPGVQRLATHSVKGAVPSTCAFFGGAAPSLVDIAPTTHVSLDAEGLEGAEVLCAFDDGSPLLLARPLGRGMVFVSTVPFDLEASELPLRPAFLVLLDRFVERARERGGRVTVAAGGVFTFAGADRVEGRFQAPNGASPVAVPITGAPGALRAPAPRIGRYSFAVDGDVEVRAAYASDLEVDLTPHALGERAHDPSLGGVARKLDFSPYVALGLLVLMVLELALRAFAPRTAPEVARDAQ
ncbi:MAG: VWA domain-containing protein [Polyangiaceae bacterium]